MRWIQRHSRIIASAALAGMILPFAVTAISAATAIPPFHLAVILVALIAVGLVMLARANRADNDSGT